MDVDGRTGEMSDTVLEFSAVTVEGGHLYDTALWQVSFRLAPGELVLVYLEEGHLHTPLADAAQGLVEPAHGRVRFQGRDWALLDEDRRALARARIGRGFEAPAWISELDMDDNIMLAQRHHTRRTDAEIRDEASALARLFSLPGLPRGRPSELRAPDLRRAACVRAFLGKPELLILERPTAGVYPSIMPALMTAIRSARARGAAVLWTSDDWALWNDPGVKASARCKMTGSQLSSLAGE